MTFNGQEKHTAPITKHSETLNFENSGPPPPKKKNKTKNKTNKLQTAFNDCNELQLRLSIFTAHKDPQRQLTASIQLAGIVQIIN